MTEEFEAARPRHTLPLAGREYDLLATFEAIEAVEVAMKRGLPRVAVDVARDMPAHELALLLSTVLTRCGHPLTVDTAKALLWEQVGLTGEANDLLRLHLYAFLRVCSAPPPEREAEARRMGELLGGLARDPASPGATTSGPASAS